MVPFMSLDIEIITVGDELLNGTVTDTNSAWLGQALARLGASVHWRQTVPDLMDDIVAALRLGCGRADVVIVGGGLGPTSDDLTAAAAAQFLGVPVETHPEALAQVRARYAKVGRATRAIDEKQASLPQGCTVLENPVGTAPAFSIASGRATAMFLPGVPHEWRTLNERYVLPEIERRLRAAGQPPPVVATWKLFGVTESGLAHIVTDLGTEGLGVHYRAHFPEIHLTVESTDGALINAFGERLLDRVGEHCFGGSADRFPAVVNALLRERGWTLATAESCTGGLMSQLVTSEAGASDVFLLGAVTYSNDAKARMVGVDPALIAAHGAVSREVAEAMARGVRELAGSTLGVGITGIAGPGGGTPEKPVGTVHVALATAEHTFHRRVAFPWDRERVRTISSYVGIELVRRHCLGLSIE